jgi:DNA-binding HxlR family transcriptional regulator
VARTKKYRHYCPAARALEVVGEKWSLLIVRDLLFGPQRFTDLLGSLGGITPKWLTLRLRDMEAAGIVVRDEVAGRRAVWYHLTPKGRDLMPVIEALGGWGLRYTRPPEPGEAIHPARAVADTAYFLNTRGIRPPQPSRWVVKFPGNQAHAVRYDGERWFYDSNAADGDVEIETTLESLVTFLIASPTEQARLLPEFRITGLPERVDEFRLALVSDAP